jgi:hypothetical protein
MSLSRLRPIRRAEIGLANSQFLARRDVAAGSKPIIFIDREKTVTRQKQ